MPIYTRTLTKNTGNAIARVKSTDSVKVLTIRATAFEKAATTGGAATVETLSDAPAVSTPVAAWVKDEVVKSERPDLTAATTVVSGGRALKSGENFKILYDLADKLGAAVGASRAAVDAGAPPRGGCARSRCTHHEATRAPAICIISTCFIPLLFIGD